MRENAQACPHHDISDDENHATRRQYRLSRSAVTRKRARYIAWHGRCARGMQRCRSSIATSIRPIHLEGKGSNAALTPQLLAVQQMHGYRPRDHAPPSRCVSAAGRMAGRQDGRQTGARRRCGRRRAGRAAYRLGMLRCRESSGKADHTMALMAEGGPATSFLDGADHRWAFRLQAVSKLY